MDQINNKLNTFNKLITTNIACVLLIFFSFFSCKIIIIIMYNLYTIFFVSMIYQMKIYLKNNYY